MYLQAKWLLFVLHALLVSGPRFNRSNPLLMPVPRFLAVGVAVPAQEVQGNETPRTCEVYGRAKGQASRRWRDIGGALCAGILGEK